MIFTVGNWVLFAIIFIVFLVTSIAVFCNTDDKIFGVVCILVCILLLAGTMVGVGLWNTRTASGQRALKDNYSNFKNGIQREITITAEDGREIFHYEGKVDIETRHSEGDTGSYILFESEEGLRYIIYYGITDTMLIVEKAG